MLTLNNAQQIVAHALIYAREKHLKPLCVAVLDERGVTKSLQAEDGVSLKRVEIAVGKASGALALGIGSRAIMRRAEQQGYFVASVTHAVGGALIPVPGGVLIKQAGYVIGAVGISGDTSDSDEAAALAAIEAASFEGDPG